ncbi:MAG TPA: SseB family protein [Bacillota bacterium]|nr:SseB family protein [Bacillota bacterium]
MTKKNLLITNEGLLESWKQYRAQLTEESETAFIEELRTARFLVPIDKKIKKEKTRGRVTRFLILVALEQKNFLPTFTDVHEWEKWPFPEEDAAVISYEELMQILSGDPQRLDGISINPFGQNLTLNREELALIDIRTLGAARRRMH